MKIMRSKLMGLLALSLSLFFVGCDKEIEQSDLTLDNNETAKITIYAYADIDKTSHGYEFVPNGTKAFILIDNDQYNSSASGITLDTVVVRNGKIEANIKTTNAGVDVRVVIPDFVAKQKQPFGSEAASLSYLYKGNKSLDAIYPGEDRVAELFCTYTKMSSEKVFVSRKFKIEAVTDVDEGSKKVTGVEVTFYTDGWSASATTDTDGELTIEVPEGEDVSAQFEAKKKWDPVESSTKLYLYKSIDFGNYTTSSPVATTISFGGGQLHE